MLHVPMLGNLSRDCQRFCSLFGMRLAHSSKNKENANNNDIEIEDENEVKIEEPKIESNIIIHPEFSKNWLSDPIKVNQESSG